MKNFITLLLSLLFFSLNSRAQSPAIKAVYPSNSLPGKTITISGTNFTGATAVQLSGMDVTSFTVVSSTSISATIPANAYPLKQELSIHTPAGKATTMYQINKPPAPVITSFSPLTVVKGGTVTITGSNLSYVNDLFVNNTPLGRENFTIISNTSIAAKIPFYFTTGKLKVVSYGGESISTSDLTIVDEASPTISSFTPTTGHPGTEVTITGSNFTSVFGLTFGSAPTTFKINSATSITAVVPFDAVTGKIELGNSGGTALSSGNFTVTLPPPPSITSFSPASGLAGSIVTITGTNFINLQEVLFKDIIISDIIEQTLTSISFRIPPITQSGKLSVVTTGGTAVSTTDLSSTIPPAPVITSFSPATATVGSIITISGNNFSPESNVYISNEPTDFTYLSSTSITARVPATGTAKIVIETFGGQAMSSTDFIATDPPVPTISSFSPTSGFYNTPITITGTNFTEGMSVSFGGGPATFEYTLNSPTSLTVKLPWASNSGKIEILNVVGAASQSATDFTRTAEGIPTITNISPSSAPIGSTITITGTNLLSAFHLRINELYSEDFIVNSSTSISAKVPDGATTGKIWVQTSNTAAESPMVFTVTSQAAPTLASFSPASGSIGSTVTITGTNLLPTYYILFNGIETNTFNVNSATSVTVTVPSGATSGKLTIVTAGGTSVSAGNFTVTAATPPTISSFTPGSGSAGSTVTVTGTNFLSTSQVLVNTTAATDFTVNSASTLTFKVPAGATSGKITIVTAEGTALSSGTFTVTTTSTGTYTLGMLKDINIGSPNSTFIYPAPNLRRYAESGSSLFFYANDGINGGELWKTDGTEGGTVMVKNIAPGSIGSDAKYLTDVNGTLFFVANTENNNYSHELWKSDGTANGTVMIKDINPGIMGSEPTELVSFKGQLYFSADTDANGKELWKSDGTEGGTVMVKDTYSGALNGDPQNFLVWNNTLYFTASDENTGRKLWKSDGTTAGTTIVKNNIYPRFNNDPDNTPMAVVNNYLYFIASGNSSPYGYELWKTDGTDAGTTMVKDINPGTDPSFAQFLTNVNGTLFFFANDGTHGFELWKSDGTSAGTVMVKDINPGATGGMNTQSPYHLLNTVVNGIFYFRANDGVNGSELWKSDGTAAGTVMVKDIYAGSSSSSPAYLFNFNNTLYFQATDYSTNGKGAELWKSDGTTAGTVLVQDIFPGSSGSVASPVIVFNNEMYLTASDNTHGFELWKWGINSVTSIPQYLDNSAAALYPNPCTEHLIIELEDYQNATAEIMNVQGMFVKSIPIQAAKTEIKTDDLISGIYLIKIKSPAGILIKKIAKN